ncbi:MAG TPA: OmpA family protein [Verrucomicrobiae bacterium]|nr:OmpA family protein [Verrucomicrobiae bacterium]
MNLFLATILIATAGLGCKKTPKNVTTIPGMQNRAPVSDQMGNMQAGPGTGIGVPRTGAGGSELKPGDIANPIDGTEDRSALADMTIHFEYDRSAIKTSEQPKLDQVATFMKNTPGVQLRIEGNCDERGTPEYNRALGERRAIAGRDYLIQKHGIPSDRITTVSYGEDKPVDLGKTEESYAKNRRDDFVILRPK